MATPVQAAVQSAAYDEFFRSINEIPGQNPGESVEAWLERTGFERIVRSTGAEGSGAAEPIYRWDYSHAEEFDKVVRETTADGAWKAWEGAKSSQGAVSQAPKVSASPQTAIKNPGVPGATVGGLLSMSLPTWVAAASPLIGVAVGAGLYELSPEFWTKVSQTLLPWCYENTQVMPVVVDKYGNTYIDKEAVEALKRIYEEEGIGGDEKEPWENPEGVTGTYYFGRPTIGSIPTGGQITRVVGSPFACSIRNPNTGDIYSGVVSYTRGDGYTWERDTGGFPVNIYADNSYTYDGVTIYYSFPVLSVTNYSGVTPSTGTVADLLKTFIGNKPGYYYPEGTSKWGGIAVDIAELPITEVYTDPEKSDTRDFIPVSLPIAPGESVDPSANPDPTTNADPEQQISPYINPSISSQQYPSGSESTGEDGEELDKSAPIPLPYPPTQEAPSPEGNPSDKPKKDWPAKFVDAIPPIDSGDITLSPIPSIGSPTDGGVGGLVSVYNPTYSELQAFSNWLWVTYQDATIDKIWNNPFDGIISLYEIYATPIEGARKYIKSGFLVSTVECATLPQRYIEINCGTAVFPEYYGNYLDYSPYSKAMCYLPFIGVMELNVDDIVGHAVNITYRVDVYTGGCIAIITCAREGSNVALYQFSGNCSVQLPIAGGTQSAIRAAQISAGAYQNAYHTAGLAGLAGGLASALFGGANFITGPVSGISQFASSSAFGQANGTSQTVSAKSSVQHSGQFGESYGAMGHKKPYMIIKRPVQVIVPGYQQVYGFQAHKMLQIGACTGFLRCRAVHVISAQATDEEKSMIEQLLVSGVYVTEE